MEIVKKKKKKMQWLPGLRRRERSRVGAQRIFWAVKLFCIL